MGFNEAQCLIAIHFTPVKVAKFYRAVEILIETLLLNLRIVKKLLIKNAAICS